MREKFSLELVENPLIIRCYTISFTFWFRQVFLQFTYLNQRERNSKGEVYV